MSAISSRPLYGLVLSGGKSQRMGHDKGKLNYHGISQRAYLYALLKKQFREVFVSIRQEQEDTIDNNLPFIIDSHSVSGPFNGILSAMKKYPGAAWLVMACDLPLAHAGTIQTLIAERDPGKLATAYALQGSSLPEPMLAIWEPAAFKAAIAFTAEGKTCPRKFLLNQEIKLLYAQNDEELYNANAPEDMEFIYNRLNNEAGRTV